MIPYLITSKIYPIFRPLLLCLAFLLLLSLLYSHPLSESEHVSFWNSAILLTQLFLTQKIFFFFAFHGSDFCPNFLFNIQTLHDDLCRYHIPTDVFSSSIRSKEEDLLALWCVVVFIFCFPRGHDTLSDMRSCALIYGGHISPLSFSLGQKFSIPLASSRDYQCGFLGISF